MYASVAAGTVTLFMSVVSVPLSQMTESSDVRVMSHSLAAWVALLPGSLNALAVSVGVRLTDR